MESIKIENLAYDHTLDREAMNYLNGGWGLVGKIGSWVANRAKRVYKRLRRGQYYDAYRTLLSPFLRRSRRRDFRK